MILKKAYGETTVTGAAALLMALSIARTFGAYTLQSCRVLGVSRSGYYRWRRGETL